ncbi:MAG TPA: glycerol-3-phosphate 1-O-acyltransferase PlsY [Bacillota bacterium]|nr:glycerol-3-phosphate 1-O-acyltransferase PlsY [Bacillota bacterium]
MSEMAVSAAAIVIAYMIGNISPATLISKASGVDIRKEGSGNPGTTNMLRIMGKKAALLTLVIDVLKGVAGVLVGAYLGGEALSVLCGLAVFTGHIFPAIYGFKGGKGIATAFGVLLALHINIALICLGVAALGFVTARRVSVGSLLAALSLPFLAWLYMPDYILVFTAMAIIVLIKHRSNLMRLIKGEEPKISFKRKDRT